jgi:hypothetical protein
MAKHHQILSQLLYKHLTMHPARIDSMAQMIFCLVTVGNGQLTALSRAFDSLAKTSSTLRRLHRFFQFQAMELVAVARVTLYLT